jgi:hypothetical protein
MAFPARVGQDGVVVDQRLAIVVGLGALTALAVAGWVAVVSALDFRQITDVGIVSILPPAAYALLAVLATAFVVALRMRPLSQPLLVLQLTALVFMLYGAPALFEEMPRFVTAWLHVGFADAIAETGRLFPFRDARFDWPTFFVLSAFMADAVGMDNLLPILAWVPVVQVILYLAPLYLIYRSATGDLRLIWLGLWIFVMTNWVGQDYFSPQGMNVLLMLTILAVLLTWFRRAPSGPAWLASLRERIPFLGPARRRFVVDPNASLDDGPEARLTQRQQIGLVAILGLIFGFSVASHQLTPFAIMGGITLLVIFGRLRPRGLVVIMAVLLTTWITFMASTFLAGHLAGLLEEVGSPGDFAQANVANRLRGSEGHLFVIQVRLFFTLAIWALALIGGLRRIWSGRFDLSLALLAAAPFVLILLQGYGGEMLLRIFLFSLPFMAFFIAALVFPTARPSSWALSLMIVIASMGLLGGFVVSRYGNEKVDLVSAAEFQAVEVAAALAEPGDTLASVNHAVPLGYRDWHESRIGSLSARIPLDQVGVMISLLPETILDGQSGYLIITRSNEALAELFGGVDAEEWDRLMRIVEGRIELEPVFRNRDATIYKYVGSERAGS